MIPKCQIMEIFSLVLISLVLILSFFSDKKLPIHAGASFVWFWDINIHQEIKISRPLTFPYTKQWSLDYLRKNRSMLIVSRPTSKLSSPTFDTFSIDTWVLKDKVLILIIKVFSLDKWKSNTKRWNGTTSNCTLLNCTYKLCLGGCLLNANCTIKTKTILPPWFAEHIYQRVSNISLMLSWNLTKLC